MTPSQTLKILQWTINEDSKGPAGCQKPQLIVLIPYIVFDRKYFAHSVCSLAKLQSNLKQRIIFHLTSHSVQIHSHASCTLHPREKGMWTPRQCFSLESKDCRLYDTPVSVLGL